MKVINKIENILWIIIISAIVFYLFPIICYFLKDQFADIYANICVIFINNVYCFALGLILSKKNKFEWYYSLLVPILYIPSVFFYYNFSAIYYSIIYMLLIIIGSLINQYKKNI